MFNTMVSAALQDIHKTRQVGVHIGVRILQRVTYAGLRGEVCQKLWPVLAKRPCDVRAILRGGDRVR